MQSPEQINPSLMNNARAGVIWVAAITWGTKLISIATTLVLARILAPNDYGLVAVATIVISALAVFTDLGLGSAIIHSKADRDRMASTAFFLMPIIGIVLYTFAYITAPAVSALLGSPASTALIRVIGLNLILSSFTIVPSILLEKDMAYRKKVVPDLAPTIIYVFVAIYFAKVLHLGAYSIAYGAVIQGVASLILNWLFARWAPKLLFDKAIASQLFKYGRNVLGGSILLYITTNMDNTFVSRSSGAAALGLYAFAYNLANLPATHIGDVLGRVLFPSFVKMGDDPTRLRANYVRSLRFITLITYPVIMGLAAISLTAIPILLGSKWVNCAPIIISLSGFTLIRVFSGATGSLLLATGKTRLILITGVSGLVFQAGLLPLLLIYYKLGAVGAGIAVSLSALLNLLILASFLYKLYLPSMMGIWRFFESRVFPSFMIFIVVFPVNFILNRTSSTLLIEIILGAITYLATLWLVDGKETAQELKLIINSR
jgi:O-antigen/teichoic acid export membrane protein